MLKSGHQDFIWFKYFILWNVYNVILQTVIYSCDQICIFSIITPVFSVTWSSEIIIIYWFAAQETFLIIINVENSRAAQFVETVMHLIFSVFFEQKNIIIG